MSSDEGEAARYEENLFADEAEVSGSDRGRSGDERSGDEQNGNASGSGDNVDKKDNSESDLI
jgi:hypothetical protein